MVNNHRHSYGESIKKPPRALLLNSIQTTNYALNVRFRSIDPQTPTTVVGLFFEKKDMVLDACVLVMAHFLS